MNTEPNQPLQRNASTGSVSSRQLGVADQRSFGRKNMKHFVLAFLLFSGVLAPLKADSSSLEKRVAAIEKELATLKEENRKLKESAVEFLSAELRKKETEHARLVYRTQVLPMMKNLLADFGSKAPRLPKEEEIETMADAYKPFAELMASLASVADPK